MSSPPRPWRCWTLRALGCLLPLALAASVSATDPARSSSPGAVSAAPDNSALQDRAEHLARLGADAWHAGGFRGQGVKVAILDSGWRGYRAHLGKALPAAVTAHSFRADGNLEAKASQHGILCAEVVHAVAPDAELLLANWDQDAPQQFLEAVRWARAQGARVLSCSVVSPSWSNGDGGGAIHQELAALLGPGSSAGDLLLFASAGNTTERHWGGPFRDGGDGQHAWQPGQVDNDLRPWGDDLVSAELYWQPGADYDLYVYDTATGAEVGHAVTTHRPANHSSAVVRFQPQPGHSYRVRVRRVNGTPGTFHLCSGNASLQYTTSPSSVCFPADGERVVAMGAVDYEAQRQWYSACGPNSSRPKPDLVAQVPFPSLWRERPFGGTSAAAPQGAALAALVWSRHSGWTADQVRTALRAAARDLERPGPDFETGFGLIRLPRE